MQNIYLGRDFKVSRIVNYSVRAFVRISTFPFNHIKDSKLKEFVRRLVLRLQNSLPIELATHKSQVAVQIGTPRPRTVRRFLKTVGTSGVVVVMEAEPHNYERLRNSFANVPNLHLVQAAAWHSTCKGKLSISPFSGDHKVSIDDVKVDNDLRTENADMAEIDVQFMKIDDVMNDLGINELNYLSVTVNGAELNVLQGAKNILEASENARVYAKGHSLDSSNVPLNQSIGRYLEAIGFKTMITAGEPSSTVDKSWLKRAGDIYAWKR